MRLRVAFGVFCLFLNVYKLDAAEYFSTMDSGLSPSSVGAGNISNFGNTALDVLDSPIVGANSSNGVSAFYSNMMASDLSYMALAGHHNLSKRLSLGGGVVYERVGGGNQTAVLDGEYTALGEIEDTALECVGNVTWGLTKDIHLGASGHYMYRNVFGVTGGAPSVSLGMSYVTKYLDFAATGKYLNNPVISYSNGGREVRHAQLVGSVRRRGHLLFPIELMAQTKWIPSKAAFLKGAGARVHVSDYLSVSGGYMDTPGIGTKTTGRFTLGAGLNLGNVTFDYAYSASDYIDSENQHKIAVTVRY